MWLAIYNDEKLDSISILFFKSQSMYLRFSQQVQKNNVNANSKSVK